MLENKVSIEKDPLINQFSIKYAHNGGFSNEEQVLMSIPHQMVLSPLSALLEHSLRIHQLFPAGSLLRIRFPQNNSLSSSGKEKDPFVLVKPAAADSSVQEISLTCTQILILALCKIKRDQSSTNRWNEYVHKYLMNTRPLCPVLVCSDRELEILFAGSGLASYLPKYKKHLNQEFNAILKELNPDFPIEWEEYLWTECMIKSRAFRYKPIPSDVLEKMIPSNLEWDRKGLISLENMMREQGCWCLYPTLDLMNHCPESPIKIKSSRENILACLLAGSDLKGGQEIFCNYGPKCNEELLLSYGFCIDPLSSPVQLDLEYFRLTLTSKSGTIYLKNDLMQLESFLANIRETMETKNDLHVLFYAFHSLSCMYSKMSDCESSREYQELSDHSIFKFVSIYRDSQKAILIKAISALHQRFVSQYKTQADELKLQFSEASQDMVAERDYKAGELISKLPFMFTVGWDDGVEEYNMGILRRVDYAIRNRGDILFGCFIEDLPMKECDFLEFVFEEYSENYMPCEDTDRFNNMIVVHQWFRYFDNGGNCKGNYLPNDQFFEYFRQEANIGNLFLTYEQGNGFQVYASTDVSKGTPLVLNNTEAYPPLTSPKQPLGDLKQDLAIERIERALCFE